MQKGIRYNNLGGDYMEIKDNALVCDLCGGRLEENIHTGELICDTCHIRILPDGTVDESDCE